MELLNKKAKLTHTKDNEFDYLLSQQQLRNRKLRQWYEDLQSDELTVRQNAQARLQLQLDVRAQRKGRGKLMDKCKVSRRHGTMMQLETAEQSLKLNLDHVAGLENMMWDGIPERKRLKLSRQWREAPCTLEQVLNNEQLDKIEDFLGPGRHSDDSAAKYDTQKVKEEGHGTVANQAKHVAKPFHLDDADTAIWLPHRFWTELHFSTIGLSGAAALIRLALHKQAFYQQAHNAHNAHNARLEHEAVGNITMDKGSHQFHEGRWEPSLAPRTRAQGMWELTSTKLWQYFEGGDSWDMPRWVPGGHMRIQTTSGSTDICFDFGARTFSIQAIQLPKFVAPHPFTYKAACNETGATIVVGITFLTNDFLKVHFPVFPIVQPDAGCKVLPLMNKVVELVGVYMGQVE